MTNIIDIIERNKFLKDIFPNGIDNFFIGQIAFAIDDRITMVLHIHNKPSIEVAKWGKWGENYHIITIEIIGQFIKKANVMNWQNNQCDVCQCEISQNNDCHNILFKGKDWSIELELQSLIFQRNSTYILEQ